MECGTVEAVYIKAADVYGAATQWDAKLLQCSTCLNYVGVHGEREEPLGPIAGRELRNARKHIHDLIDPLWRGRGRVAYRIDVYREMANQLGIPEYHTEWIRDIQEARKVYKAGLRVAKILREKKNVQE